MKILFAFASLFIFCSGNNNLKVVDAYQQDFAGGHPRSGAGTAYHIIIQLTNPSVSIKNLWIEGKEVEFEVRNANAENQDNFKNSHSVELVSTYRANDWETFSNVKTNGKKFPLKNAKHAIGYAVGKKMFYQKINAIRVAPKINYQ